MKLYLDINKAVSQMPSTGQDTQDEDRSAAANTRSYAKDYAGAASGDGLNAGSVTKAEDEDEVEKSSVLEDAESERNSIGSDNPGLVKKPKGKGKEDKAGIGKSLTYTVATELSKSATRMIDAVTARASYLAKSQQPNPTEVEFLKSLGYTTNDINSGQVRITGLNRSRFNRWLCQNLAGSISNLEKSIRNL